MASWTLELNGHTARLNELMAGIGKKIRLRKRDDAWILAACRSVGMVPAEGKRRVTLTVILGPRQHADEDCWLKSLLDSLKRAGAIKNDSPRWLEWGGTTQVRGAKPGMRVVIEDVEG